MREELDLEALLITRGEEGMSLFLKGDERIQIPTDAKEVYDVTGAGDTVIGILAAAIACGAPIVDAVILANRAAGEVVKEVGTTAITRDRLLTAFS
jgi:bifunctional ADP-heptose synthase (sugar kinase/adenylyltransferase)